MIEITIYNNGRKYYPAVLEGISWSTERQGTPSTLNFTVYQDGKLKMEEGNAVSFLYDGQKVFFGFIFTIKRTSDRTLDITAYDQLRYLKNKDTYSYVNKSTSELVKMIAADFHLNTGKIEDTAYKMSRNEDNTSLFDMIINSIRETTLVSKKLYVLYDDFGHLSLRDFSKMRLNLKINSATAEDFTYSTSIDTNTYNKIKLIYDNNSGSRETFVERDIDGMNKWGVLQYFETINDASSGKQKAKTLLSMYSMTSKEFSIKNCFGDVGARAGFCIFVDLNLDVNTMFKGYMLIEKAKHTFENGSHFMDLTLKGADFNS
ncbi:MAG TPA: hydrolase [Lachnospiraceae bacterium]|nr:hydrolase [Lachnospiraceae bacterium]